MTHENRTTNGNCHRFTLNLADFGADSLRPMKLKLTAGSDKWCVEADPAPTLGKDVVLPGDYGWLMPPEN